MFREPLLQSSLWQAFQEKNGKMTLRGEFGLGVVERLPLVGPYLYLPRGPVVTSANFKFQISTVAEEILRISKGLNAGWVRVEPEDEAAVEALRSAFGAERVVRALHSVQPQEILVMDITPSEPELLAQMKGKTRYNVRLAEKHGVTVRFSRDEADMERFIQLIHATTGRKAIRPHPEEYYRNFFRAFAPAECVLALAEHAGTVRAANLLVFHDGAAYYLHGGSSDRDRHLMAPYLLQWECIREAKRRGATVYDLGGINTRDEQSAWAGITRFKQGLAPATQPVTFPGAYDIVVTPWRYRAYRLLQRASTARRFFR